MVLFCKLCLPIPENWPPFWSCWKHSTATDSISFRNCISSNTWLRVDLSPTNAGPTEMRISEGVLMPWLEETSGALSPTATSAVFLEKMVHQDLTHSSGDKGSLSRLMYAKSLFQLDRRFPTKVFWWNVSLLRC